MTAQSFMPMVDGQLPTWSEQAARANQAGSNFLMILPRGNAVKEQFCRAVQIAPARLPKPLGKSNLFLLSPHIQPEAFDRILQAMENGAQVIFFQQLDLPTTQPPNVKPYLVYCDIWGIVSQHNNLHDARQSWSDYLQAANAQRPSPEPGIYMWDGKAWHSMEE